jgi:hypothetical protein
LFLEEDHWFKSSWGAEGRKCKAEDGWLGRFHYNLLKSKPDCPRAALDSAWKEWVRLGKFERGEEQRLTLMASTGEHAERRLLYLEAMKLLGGEEESRAFRKKWEKIGLEEQKLRKLKGSGELKESGKEWQMFAELNSLWEGLPDTRIREPLQLLLPGLDVEKRLGRQVYS